MNDTDSATSRAAAGDFSGCVNTSVNYHYPVGDQVIRWVVSYLVAEVVYFTYSCRGRWSRIMQTYAI